MQRIVNAIGGISVTMDEISRATAEQAGGIEQINSAVAEMDQNTQHNAALVRESAAATETLKGQSRSLVESIGTLRTT